MSGRAIQCVLTTPRGDVRRYTFFQPPLKDLHRVWFDLLEKIFIPLLKGELKFFQENEDGEKKKENLNDGLDEIVAVLKDVGFDGFWDVAETLLACYVVDNKEHRFVEQDDYFDDKPVELYLAVVKAIGEMYRPFLADLKVVGDGTSPDGSEGNREEKPVPTATNPGQRDHSRRGT